MLGTKFVPDHQPTFVAGFRVWPTGGTLQSRVIKPRNEVITLVRVAPAPSLPTQYFYAQY